MANLRGIKKEKIVKRPRRKKNMQKFFDSNCVDLELFLKGCKGDENLLIYTCLSNDELLGYIDQIRDIEKDTDKLKKLIEIQPFMNDSLELFNKCVDSISNYIKGYINYGGYSLANSLGDYEDYASDLWLKYLKICDFYRTRWFFPEKLKKTSSVVFNPVLYKEFIFIVRFSISGERKHLAFLATQNQEASLFKLSLDSPLQTDNSSENEKCLGDVVEADSYNENTMVEDTNLKVIFSKALKMCSKYSDVDKYYDEIEAFYDIQDPSGFDKKVVMLGKIFLYKAGLESPKTVQFINGLSSTLKAKYNINNSRLMNLQKKYKTHKKPNYRTKKEITKNSNKTWMQLIVAKRGEI